VGLHCLLQGETTTDSQKAGFLFFGNQYWLRYGPYKSLVKSVGPFPSRFTIRTLHGISFWALEARCTDHPAVPDLIILMIFDHLNDIWRTVKKNRKLHHYEVFSILLYLPLWQLRTLPSSPCSQTSSSRILPSCKTKFHVLQTWHDMTQPIRFRLFATETRVRF